MSKPIEIGDAINYDHGFVVSRSNTTPATYVLFVYAINKPQHYILLDPSLCPQ